MIHLYGVWFENGELFLDHYSGYVQIQSEERFPYKDILRPTDQAYTEGELVRVVGQVRLQNFKKLIFHIRNSCLKVKESIFERIEQNL